MISVTFGMMPHHIHCMNMDKITYEALENSSCVLGCNKCGKPNYSSSLLNSYSDIEHTNRLSAINTATSLDLNSSPLHKDKEHRGR